MEEELKESGEIDYLGSAEFDLTEAIKDFVYGIKSIKQDVEMIKKQLKINS